MFVEMEINEQHIEDREQSFFFQRNNIKSQNNERTDKNNHSKLN